MLNRQHTLFIPFTLLTISLAHDSKNFSGNLKDSAVIPSTDVTALKTQILS